MKKLLMVILLCLTFTQIFGEESAVYYNEHTGAFEVIKTEAEILSIMSKQIEVYLRESLLAYEIKNATKVSSVMIVPVLDGFSLVIKSESGMLEHLFVKTDSPNYSDCEWFLNSKFLKFIFVNLETKIYTVGYGIISERNRKVFLEIMKFGVDVVLEEQRKEAEKEYK